MSSLEANSYSSKQVTTAKPISTLITSTDTNQPKRIQPLANKPEHITNQPPTKFQLKNLHKSPPASIQVDIGKPRQLGGDFLGSKVPVANTPIQNTLSHLPPQHKLILPGPADVESKAMGNADSRNTLTGPVTTGQTIMSTIPLTAASSSTFAGSAPVQSGQVTGVRQLLPNTGNNGSNAEVQQLTPSQASQQPMASIIKATGQPAEARIVTASVNATIPTAKVRNDHTTLGRVNTASITAQHTAVIQAPSIRTHQQPALVRPATPPNRSHQLSHRSSSSTSATIAPVGGQSNQNPTTVQITIHQPKHTVSTPSDRSSVVNQVRPLAIGVPPLASAAGQPQVLQKLVISQSSAGVIHQNKNTVTIAPMDSSRATSVAHMVRKPFLKSSAGGQHDFARQEIYRPGEQAIRKPTMVSVPADNVHQRSGMAIHPYTLTDSNSGGMYHTSPGQYANLYPQSMPTAANISTYPYTTNQYRGHHPAAAHTVASVSMSSQIIGRQVAVVNNKLPHTTENQTGGDNNTSTSSTMSSPRPSILRKRPIDRVEGTVVVRKVLQGADSSTRHYGEITSGLVSPAKSGSVSVALHGGDNASQSSTDTAMSSESPTQVKHEPVERIKTENGEPASVDVTPRKKPRKQLLNTVSELKDQHDSSTEEETETKLAWLTSSASDTKIEAADDVRNSPIKDEYVDKEGIRWVKMRERQQDPLLCYYNITWKTRHNHFQKHMEVKAKEERRPIVSEMASQKGVQQRASGWKFYHLSDQFQDMISTENKLSERMSSLQNLLTAKRRQSNPEVNKVYELAQANKQRCSLIRDQLQEAKTSMLNILDTHKGKITEIIQKHHSKRAAKKKDRL